jgi:hypothetical protein
MSHLILEQYGCNTSRTVLFLKTYGDETLRCPYKDCSSLTGGKITMIYYAFTFYNLLFCNDAPIPR